MTKQKNQNKNQPISDPTEHMPTAVENPKEPEMSKIRLLKNCCVIGISVMLFLCGFNTCNELQSSINIKDGLGTYTQTVLNGVGLVSSVILPPLIMMKIGLKYSIVSSLIAALPFYLSNFYPTWPSMMTGAALTGIFTTSIWPAKSTYLTRMAEKYSEAFNTPLDSTVSMFFGVFYAFYYFGYIWGNVLSFKILKPVEENIMNETELKFCGLTFCDSDAQGGNSNFAPVPDIEIYILFGSFALAAICAALLVIFFLDPLEPSPSSQLQRSPIQAMLFTLKTLFTELNQLLVAPMSIFRGLGTTFLSSEFTKAYITCSWGVHNVGLVMIGYGVVSGISSFGLGKLVRWTGRFPIFTGAILIHISVAFILVYVAPRPENSVWYFVVACLLGVSNSVWESQVAGIYGILFPLEKEVSFNIYALAETVGFFIAYGYSSALCMPYKFGIYLSVAGLAYLSYLYTEFRLIRAIKSLATKSG